MRPPFRGFFYGRLVSLFGSAMSPVALSLAVLDASGRLADLGIVLASQVVPQLLLLLVGGVVADRFSRRAVLIGSNLAAGVAQTAVAIVFLTTDFNLVLVAALTALNGAASAFGNPALRGIVPDLVPTDSLQQANSILSTTRNASRIVGPTVGGVLVATIGGGYAIAFDAATFFLAAVFLSTLPLPAKEPRPRKNVLRELGEGWAAFRNLRWVAAMAFSFSLINLFNTGPWLVLGPTITKTISGETAWGIVLSVRATGLLVMSVLMYRLTFRYPLRAGATLGILAALPLLALGRHAPLAVLLAAAFVGALGFTVAGVTWETSLQTHVPRQMLARVASFDDLLSFATVPIGQLLVGPVAEAFGAERVALVCGVGYVLASLAPLVFREVRQLPREARRSDEADGVAGQPIMESA
jgi:MFS family permease